MHDWPMHKSSIVFPFHKYNQQTRIYAGSMLGQRQRRRIDIDLAFRQCFVCWDIPTYIQQKSLHYNTVLEKCFR